MNSPHIIGFDPNAQKYLHQIHRFRCHFSPRINWTRSVQDAKKSTGEKIERQWQGLRFIGKSSSEFEGEPWAMYCFFVDHESDGFRYDEHDNCDDLTWTRISSISWNMWSMYQYVCSIYIWTDWDLFVKELLMILQDHVPYLLIIFSSYPNETG